jgi:hypothetical protein
MSDLNPAKDPPTIADLEEEAGLHQRLTWAREVLALGESETRSRIEEQSKMLLKRWHPDLINNQNDMCQTYTRQIILAKKIIDDYCHNYQFSFSQQEADKYLSPQEWHWRRFGDEPL